MQRLHISKSALVSSQTSTLKRVTVNGLPLQIEEQRRHVPTAYPAQGADKDRRAVRSMAAVRKVTGKQRNHVG